MIMFKVYGFIQDFTHKYDQLYLLLTQMKFGLHHANLHCTIIGLETYGKSLEINIGSNDFIYYISNNNMVKWRKPLKKWNDGVTNRNANYHSGKLIVYHEKNHRHHH